MDAEERKAEYRELKKDIVEIAYSLKMPVAETLDWIVPEAEKRQDTPEARTADEIYCFAFQVDKEITKQIWEKRYVVDLNYLRARHDGTIYDWRIARTAEIKKRAQKMLWKAIMEKL